MITVSEISSAVAAGQALLQVAKKALQHATQVEAKAVAAELVDRIVDLQAKLLAAQAQMEELDRARQEAQHKLVEKEEWEREKQRYELRELAPGILVRAPKEPKPPGEPDHYLCPHCFDENRKSLLQRPSTGHTNYKCHRCSLEIRPTPSPPPRPTSLHRRIDRTLGL